MEGNAILAIVAAVARDDPQTELKPPQAIIVAIAKPPFLCLSHALAALYNSSARPALTTKLPINKNKGKIDKV